jgi:hypothetical protein
MSVRIKVGALVLAAALGACERSVPTSGSDAPSEPPSSPTARYSVERDAMDRLARKLDRSPFREHKMHLQRLLLQPDRRVLKEVARLSASTEAELDIDLSEAIPLEIYFPVPAHQVHWSGGSDVLVASAREDGEAPVAYDVTGRREILSPDNPPATPVLAVVPVETDFAHPAGPGAEATCTDCGGGGTGGGSTSGPPPGLYITYSHFVQDFEGWLKGSPEFEYHILGQAGTSDSLKDYQCAGGSAGGYYHFDQNELSWSGSVLLFSQAQLNNYKTAHPSQNFRIIALEDDDTGCVIKFDAGRFRNVLSTIQAQYPNLTGAKDTTSSTLAKVVKRANALQKILSAVYSFITTQDDFIGNAVEDVVVGVFYSGANWILKGENNTTKGWTKLVMR